MQDLFFFFNIKKKPQNCRNETLRKNEKKWKEMYQNEKERKELLAPLLSIIPYILIKAIRFG